MEYCCDLTINSSPMTGKQNVLFCYWWLPLHPNAKKKETTTKDSVESWEKQPMILEIRASVHLPTIHWFYFICLVNKYKLSQLSFQKLHYHFGLLEQLPLLLPPSLYRTQSITGWCGACCMVKTKQPQSKPWSLRFRPYCFPRSDIPSIWMYLNT